jgi:hypothetical protein
MVGLEQERRQGERRASLHLATAADRRGKDFRQDLNNHERARIELLLVEIQAAGEYAHGANEHALAEAKKLLAALTTALEANAAAIRAAHIAAGIVSGASS